jgi:hypothetical protein
MLRRPRGAGAGAAAGAAPGEKLARRDKEVKLEISAGLDATLS